MARGLSEADLRGIDTGGTSERGAAPVGGIDTGRRPSRSPDEIRRLISGGAGAQTPSIGERIGGGVLRGLAESDPITSFVFDKITDAFPDATEQQMTALIERTRTSRLADVFSYAGEFAPSLALGMGAFTVGRALAVRGVSALGKQQIAKLGAAQALERQAGRTAARQIAIADRAKMLGAEFGSGGAKAGRLAPVPKLETAAEIGGGAVGIGGLVGTEELVDGAPISEAAKQALVATALSVGFDGMLRTVGGMVRKARTVDRDPVDARGLESIIESSAPIRAETATQIGKLSQALNNLNGVRAQEIELIAGRTSKLRLRNLQSLSEEQLPLMFAQTGGGAARPAAQRFRDSTIGERIASQKRLAKQERAIRQTEKKIRGGQGTLQALNKFNETPISGYTQGTPYNPAAVREFFDSMKLQLAITPESFKGRGSRVINKYLEDMEVAVAEMSIARARHEGFVVNMHKTVSEALGFGSKQRKQGDLFLPLWDAWEKGADVGVRGYMASIGRGSHADTVIKQLDELNEAFLKGYEPLAKIGGEAVLTAEEMRRLGVVRFFPHVIADFDKSRLLAELTKKMGAVKAHKFLDRKTRRGIQRFGSIDDNREFNGSLLDKINDDMPFETNPFQAAFRYLDEVSTRLALGKKFGINGELRDTILTAAKREGFNEKIATSLLDVGFNHEYYDQSARALSKVLTDFQTGSKLALAVLPNMTQPLNTVTFSGYRNFTRGLMLRLRGEKRSEILQSVALTESVMTGSLGRHLGEARLPGIGAGGSSRLSNTMASFAQNVLKWSGFSAVEGWNRTLSAATGYHLMMDTIAKAAFGKLRGRSLDLARRRMETLGINLDDAVRKVQRNGDDYLNSEEFQNLATLGMWRASTTTQFNPNPLRRPTMWNTPVGRVMSQFKTFALGQGRFLRDQVLAEAGRGNYKPAAYFLSFYPVAGEVVGDVRSFIKGKDREEFNGVERYLSNVTMVGGAGLLSDLYTSARFGRLAESILGPTAGDTAQFMENFLQGQPSAVLGQATRMPIWQATRAVMAVPVLSVAVLKEYTDTVLEEDLSIDRKAVIDIGRLRTSK